MEETKKINYDNLTNAMAISISTFLKSYAEMLAAKRQALGESREEFLEKLTSLYNGEFTQALAKELEKSKDALDTSYFSLIDGTRAGEVDPIVQGVLSAFGIGKSELDLTAIKGVRVGAKIVNAGKDYMPLYNVRLDVMNRGTTYTTPTRDAIALETESYTIFEDENGCLMGHIPGSKKDYPLAILMDFAVGKVCDFNRKYTTIDIPKKLQDALQLRDFYVKQATFYEQMAGQEHYKGKELPYFVQKPLKDNQFNARFYGDQVKTLEEHLKSIQDPVDVRFENGTFIAKLKDKDGSQPGDDE